MAEPPSLSPAELARYSRHVLLNEVGVAGQQKLAAARVLVVGAGGLGSPVALYLAAAGVGTIGLADFDRVAAHNLQRQLLHDDSTVGLPKVTSGAARLRASNPFIRVVEHAEGVTPQNAVALFGGYDIVVDGTDNFSARYLNNDAAVLARRPLVFGSVFKFEGQVAVFAPHLGGPCYRCIFPEPPPAGSVPGCGEAGVLGALCGVIGSLQAVEVLKLILRTGEPLVGRLLTYDGLAQTFRTLISKRDPRCPACGEPASIRSIEPARYLEACQPASPAAEPTEVPWEISVIDAKHQLDHAPDRTLLVDVREAYEWQICHLAGAGHIPMRQIPERLGDLPRDRHLFIICHTGVRSLRVTEFLRAKGFTAVSNIAGGINAWASQIDPTMPRY